MVAHLILASYVAILTYHVVYSGTIGNRRTISTADIGAAAAKERSVPQSGLSELFGSGRFGPGSSARRKRKSGL